jgi:hypothetical protein
MRRRVNKRRRRRKRWKKIGTQKTQALTCEEKGGASRMRWAQIDEIDENFENDRARPFFRVPFFHVPSCFES